MIALAPLHRSGRAELPHQDLASGDDARAAERIGIADSRHRQPAGDKAPHDSEPMWVATPLPYDFFIHYNHRLTGAQENTRCPLLGMTLS